MKENRMNDNGGLKGSVVKSGRRKVLRSIASRENRAALVALSAAIALVLLSGCASVSAEGDSNPWYYNSDNGQWFR
jgi:hypothetical protein